ncbi:MAG TPA: DNA primase [Clostridium sp.]|uniref:DNA primase n=1 Tax=Clostridium sp. TaxID=1506 RepID=UPI002F955D78
MNATELIDYIIKNDKSAEILEKLECHHIKEYKTEFRCGLPSHSSKDAVSLKRETLKTKIYQSDSNIIKGNIFTLCQTIKDISFSEANRYLHNLFGLEYKFEYKKKDDKEFKDPLEIFKKVKKRRYHYDIDNLDVIHEDCLSEYMPYPHIEWIREGIMPWTCKEFNIGYSVNRKRIVVPHRYWSGGKNDYVGVMGRTVIKEWDMLDIPKYFPLKNFPKTMNLYGLQENYQAIQEVGHVVVYEAEKSVLKRHSRNDGTGVAVCCHDVSDEQVKILIGLNVDVVIAFDKGISIEHIRSTCDRFYGVRTVYYIYDKYDILKEKESPADATNKIFNYLLKYKTLYDEKERRIYLEWQEKQVNN